MTTINFNKLNNKHFEITISGRLDAHTTGNWWFQIMKKIDKTKPELLIIKAEELEYCDGAGIGLLLQLKKKQQAKNAKIKIEGLKPEFSQLMQLFEPELSIKKEPKANILVRAAEYTGKAAYNFIQEINEQISFTGEVTVKFIKSLFHPKSFRWQDTFLLTEKAGANAVGITVLLGFLIGVILAFQSAIGMQKFGAEIYVADLIVLVILRELGPLITAFVLAARTGSAYAAEIGTMKVNEEIDALKTMGFDPVRFLVIPRVLATTFVTPLVTMFNNLFGILGGGLVMLLLGFSPVVYLNQIQEAATLTDLFGGLAKTFVFGALIASIGCLRGLQTGSDAGSVGDSATRAVVSSIVAIVIADGIFAVVYYFLGI